MFSEVSASAALSRRVLVGFQQSGQRRPSGKLARREAPRERTTSTGEAPQTRRVSPGLLGRATAVPTAPQRGLRSITPRTSFDDKVREIAQRLAPERGRFLEEMLATASWKQASAQTKQRVIDIAHRIVGQPVGEIDPLHALAVVVRREDGHTATGQNTVLGHIAKLAQPEASENEMAFRAKVAADVLREIAFERVITQGKISTCGAASLQIALVHANPAEYARIVVDLVTSGQSTMAGGDTLHLPPSLRERVPGENRTQGAGVFQNALMRYIHGETYQMKTWQSGGEPRVKDFAEGDSVLSSLSGFMFWMSIVLFPLGIAFAFIYKDKQGMETDEVERCYAQLFDVEAQLHSDPHTLPALATAERPALVLIDPFRGGKHTLVYSHTEQREDGTWILMRNPWPEALDDEMGEPLSPNNPIRYHATNRTLVEVKASEFDALLTTAIVG